MGAVSSSFLGMIHRNSLSDELGLFISAKVTREMGEGNAQMISKSFPKSVIQRKMKDSSIELQQILHVQAFLKSVLTSKTSTISGGQVLLIYCELWQDPL